MSFAYASRGMTGTGACYASRGLVCPPLVLVVATGVSQGSLLMLQGDSLAAAQGASAAQLSLCSPAELGAGRAVAAADGGSNATASGRGQASLRGGSGMEI